MSVRFNDDVDNHNLMIPNPSIDKNPIKYTKKAEKGRYNSIDKGSDPRNSDQIQV
jgi:hypothetical protein